MSAVEPSDPAQLRTELLTCPRWVLTKLSAFQTDKQADVELIASLEKKTVLFSAELERVKREAALQLSGLQQQLAQASAAIKQTATQNQQLVAALHSARQEHEQQAAALVSLRSELAERDQRLKQAETQVAADRAAAEGEIAGAREESRRLQLQMTTRVRELEELLAQSLNREAQSKAKGETQTAALLQQNATKQRELAEMQQQMTALQRAREEQALQTKKVVDQTKSLVTKLVREASAKNLIRQGSASQLLAGTSSSSSSSSPLTAQQGDSQSFDDALVSFNSLPSFPVAFEPVPAPSPKSPSPPPPPLPHSTPSPSQPAAEAIPSPSPSPSPSPELPISSPSSPAPSIPSSSSSSTITPIVVQASTNPFDYIVSDGLVLQKLVHKSLRLREAMLFHLLCHHPSAVLTHLYSQSSQQFILNFAENVVGFYVSSQRPQNIIELIRTAVSIESAICQDITTFCRANTLHVKFLAFLPKTFDNNYLSSVLVPFIVTIAERDQELDVPFDHPQAAELAAVLYQLMGELLERLGASIVRLHPLIRIACHYLSVDAQKFFGHDGAIVALAGFFFLRYFSPALVLALTTLTLTPEERAILQGAKHLAPTMRLLSRLLQTLANNSSPKETDKVHTALLFDFRPRITEFLFNLCLEPESSAPELLEASADVAERYDAKKCLSNLSLCIDSCTPTVLDSRLDQDSSLALTTDFSAELHIADYFNMLVSHEHSIDLSSLSFLFSVFSANASAIDEILPKSPSQFDNFSKAFISLNYHCHPSSLARNITSIIEGEMLQESPFASSLLACFVPSLFSILADQQLSIFLPCVEAVSKAGRSALIDTARLTDQEKSSFPQHIDTLLALIAQLLQLLMGFLRSCPLPVWQAFHCMFDSIPKTYSHLQALSPAHILFSCFLNPILEPKMMHSPEASRSPITSIVLSSMFSVLRVMFGIPSAPKLDPRIYAAASFQELMGATMATFNQNLTAWYSSLPASLAPAQPRLSAPELASHAKLLLGVLKQNLKGLFAVFIEQTITLMYSSSPRAMLSYLSPLQKDPA
ncbi:MAG: hypothetical protein Q8P67_20480 [archaeon]|nr:hypothetical protein [archaeon]